MSRAAGECYYVFYYIDFKSGPAAPRILCMPRTIGAGESCTSRALNGILASYVITTDSADHILVRACVARERRAVGFAIFFTVGTSTADYERR